MSDDDIAYYEIDPEIVNQKHIGYWWIKLPSVFDFLGGLFGSSNGGTKALGCEICGVLVFSPEGHDKWHNVSRTSPQTKKDARPLYLVKQENPEVEHNDE